LDFCRRPLLSSEEYGVGGPQFGRGFDNSEIVGDQGAAGKIELIYSHALNNNYLQALQVYSFYDIGAAWNKDPSTGISPRQSLSSAGLGTRMQILHQFDGDVFLARPVTNRIASRAEEKQQDWRLQFSLHVNF
jgi:hemolysin activation/secretion protein